MQLSLGKHTGYSQSSGFSSSHAGMWELDHKEGWVLKNWCFWTGVLEKTLESPLDSKEIKHQSVLKEINPEYSLEGLMLKLKLQYFGHLIRRAAPLEKAPAYWCVLILYKIYWDFPGGTVIQNLPAVQETQETGVWSLSQEGPLEEEMAPTAVSMPGTSLGQRSLAGYSPWGRRQVGRNWAHTCEIYYLSETLKVGAVIWFHTESWVPTKCPALCCVPGYRWSFAESHPHRSGSVVELLGLLLHPDILPFILANRSI